ncbi:ABC transporter ATP-binding protein [Xylanivirga thermophila]|uniref:ABC transporter ATP-binding protein n=1 Tax=Xylanivirga thermophila TaxID=2496273 RepID=UPI00101E09A2|nr:ABC transporter ATP-binding protein [Xylanivirga thermophila]
MDTILFAQNLGKKFFNNKALDGFNIKVPIGSIVGLLGPNGSGKTTFMKIAAGLIKPSYGEIKIGGHEPGIITKSMVSYLPDTQHLYKWMRIADAIDFYDDMYDDFDRSKCMELLKFMNLTKDNKVTALSKGMYEKATLTLGLSRNAKLYIFDEPLGGIDPVAREKIMDAIISNFRTDCSFLISTHLVNDIERLFDRVTFISNGKAILEDNAEELREEKGKSIDDIYKEVFQDV